MHEYYHSDEIHSLIYKDDKIDRTNFPIYQTLKHSKGTDRDMEFYVSTEYDFETKKWTSGPGYRVSSFGVWFMARPSFGPQG